MCTPKQVLNEQLEKFALSVSKCSLEVHNSHPMNFVYSKIDLERFYMNHKDEHGRIRTAYTFHAVV